MLSGDAVGGGRSSGGWDVGTGGVSQEDGQHGPKLGGSWNGRRMLEGGKPGREPGALARGPSRWNR